MPLTLSPSCQLTFSEVRDPQVLASRPELLVLKNTGSAPVAFKVKTTAPDQYSVRPNAGKIEANSQLTLQVYLQPVHTDIKERSRDRFLIQAVELTPEEQETSDMAPMWHHIEVEEKQRMTMFRLKCVFSPTENQNATATITTTSTLLVKEGMSPRTHGTETTPPASPKPSSHNDNDNDNTSPPSSLPDLVLSTHEEDMRRAMTEVTQYKATISRLEKELSQTRAQLEYAELRSEQYKASLVDKYGAHRVQLLIEQQEQEHPILVVWVAAALTFSFLRLVI